MVFYVDSQKSSSAEEIAFLLNKCILQYPGRWSELVFLCIGSDRVTGDCLGPYIGHQLLEHLNTDTHGVYVYGTLKSPVHALNLSRISRQIKILHPEGLVIAVDASLGQKNLITYQKVSSPCSCDCHRCFSWTKKAPGVCDHRRWCTLPRCCSSERTSSCW